MARKDPSMPLYVDDWLSSSRVNCMSLAEQGAFLRLLCHCWASQSASIPDDDTALAALSGLGSAWKKSAQRIRACFQSHPTIAGTLTNQKVHELWQERKEYREQQSRNGRRSAATKRQRNVNGGSTMVEPPYQRPYQPNVNQTSTNTPTNVQPNTNPLSSSLSLNDSYLGDAAFLTAPHGPFLDWWNCLPVGMKSGEQACWDFWPEAIARIRTKHSLDESSAIELLIARTVAFGKSARGQSTKFRWSPITFLKDGHYDDSDESWQTEPTTASKPYSTGKAGLFDSLHRFAESES